MAKQHKLYNNKKAVHRIKCLYKQNKKVNINNGQSIEIVNNAMEIYKNINNNQKKYETINSMLKLLIHFKQYDYIKYLWNDIEQIKLKNTISCPIIIKCYILSKEENKDIIFLKCIQILKWMKYYKYKLKYYEIKDYSLSISKLITMFDNYSNLKLIHSLIDENDDDIFIKTALINCYGKYENEIKNVLYLFNSINDNKKDIIFIGTTMKVLINNNFNKKALEIYDNNKLFHDDSNHVLAIKACINLNNFNKGNNIYNNIGGLTKIINNIKLANIFIDFYGHFGDLNVVLNIFKSINDETKDIITYGSMMKAFIDNNQNEKLLKLYDNINNNKFNHYIKLDDICHILAIKACINLENKEKGKEIIINNNLTNKDKDLFIKSTLIDYYGKFKDINNALNIFNSINNKNKNIVIIGAMMETYFNCNEYIKCIDLFKNINKINENLEINNICYIIALKACTQSTLYHIGKDIHNQLIKNNDNNNINNNNISIKINLINFYGKCGYIKQAEKIFYDEILINKNCFEISIWNAMIKAYGINGDIKNAKNLLNKMKKNNINKDRKTYIILLNACSHCGDLNQALNIWKNQIKDKNIKYDKFIITSLVDCYSRKGLIWNHAIKFIKKYEKYHDNCYHFPMWMSLLSGSINNINNDINKIYIEMEKRFGKNTEIMIPATIMISKYYGSNKYKQVQETIENKKHYNINYYYCKYCPNHKGYTSLTWYHKHMKTKHNIHPS